MKKGGWGKKMPRTGYFGEEDWEGGGQPYKKGKAVLLHAMEALGGRGGIAPTHSLPRH
jgi:hypothetical protein